MAQGNPDSPLNILLQGLPPSGGTLAYRRDTCSGELPPWAPCLLQTGVDPNRNFSVNWGGDGASSIKMEQDYRGPYPYSETEIQNIRELSSSLNSPVSISLHTVAAQILGSPSKSDGKAVPGGRRGDEGSGRRDDRRDAGTRTRRARASGTTPSATPTTSATTRWVSTPTRSSSGRRRATSTARTRSRSSPSTSARASRPARACARRCCARSTTTVDPKVSGRVLVRAPKGTKLELKRTVRVPTSEICTVAFGLPGLIGLNTPLQCLAPGMALVVDEPVDAGDDRAEGRPRHVVGSPVDACVRATGRQDRGLRAALHHARSAHASRPRRHDRPRRAHPRHAQALLIEWLQW